MPSLTQLQYVVAVDQCRHFGRAAEMCHVSQPTLSAQLAKLEDELGVVLFDRNKQPILPTEEGVAFIEQAKVIMNESRRLEQMAKKNADKPQGELRLAIIPTIAPYLTPILLDQFVVRYPDIRLIIEELSTEKIIETLDRDLIDAGILATPLEITRVEEEPLYYEPFYLYVSEKHPLSKLNKVSENALSASEIWLLTEEHCLRDQIIDICHNKKKNPTNTNFQLKSHSLETLIELVAKGYGYTLLPKMAADLVQKRKLSGRIVEFSGPQPTREVSLVHRRGHLKQSLLRTLRDAIRAHAPRGLPRERAKSFRVIGVQA